MYSVIERHHERILAAIAEGEVREYDWLQLNRSESHQPDFQRRYRAFWSTNVARLSGGFYEAYFGAMRPPDIQREHVADLCNLLCAASVRSDGRHTLQFSFATKLLHTLNPRLPIYDSRVAWFYFFTEPSSELSRAARIEKLEQFYKFLSAEYERIKRCELLGNSVAAFRQRFDPQHHTDEKIIDWLIWAFVGLANGGAFVDGQFVFA